ncbi:hypothetical protein B0I35DRAFT_402277 [Stachybotrys elegans]|uniref:F-box domain-containing protein n=1 Tax=Stachybotrys elegans TaxID=80388 RepID=A0A8K0WJ60_9HYPO|nr:hypothetical protein B0I35DRAFT_402277 [Stachybotrys elegans]
MSVLDMPAEIIGLITRYLSLDDIFHLAVSCRSLSFVLRDGGIGRQALIQKARFSPEYTEAARTGQFARGLRCLIKRQHAIKTARPFQVALLAVCKSFIYVNGALCYSIDRENLRLLLLNETATTESTINMQGLLFKHVPESRVAESFAHHPLYYACGVLSCVYSQKQGNASKSWIVLLHIESRAIVGIQRLRSTKRIVVRNSHQYLYYGTKSQDHEDGTKRWVFHAFSFQSQEWDCKKIVLDQPIGQYVGADISFEIFDDYFYAVSSSATLDPEENKWNSFYHALRFRLGSHSSVEILPKTASWRRRPTDGAIDDRWSTLNLHQDYESGHVFVYESRREWLPSSSQPRRTCYRKKLDFPGLPSDTPQGDEASNREPAGWNSEEHQEAFEAEDIHVGDNGSVGTTFTYNNALIHSYHPSCRCFLDMVKDFPLADPHALSSPPGDNGVFFWPPEALASKRDAISTRLQKLLGPQGSLESTDWALDERNLIYSPTTAPGNNLKAIVLVSFDPALRLEGLPKLCENCAAGSCKGNSSPSAICNVSQAELGADSSLRLEGACKAVGSERDSNPDAPETAQTTTSDTRSWLLTQEAFYRVITGRDGASQGFDMTHHRKRIQ